MTGTRLLCGVAALLSSTSAVAQTGEWTLSEASGRVVIRDTAGERPGQRGSVVPAGATLMTGPGARAVAVRGEDFVTVAANSRLRVPVAAQSAGLFQMIEEWGSAVFKIKHLPQPHFAVQTPYLAAVVKGTTFSVTVTGEGASVQVIDGAVEVATNDGKAHDLVRPGVVASVTAMDRFRLAVQGQSARVIDSPERPAGNAAPAAVPGGGGGGASAPAADDDTVAWDDVSDNIIAAPISAKPVDLAAETGGLVSGKAGADLAALVAPAALRGGAVLGRGGRADSPSGKDAKDAKDAKDDSKPDPAKDKAKDDSKPDPEKDKVKDDSKPAPAKDETKADPKPEPKADDPGAESKPEPKPDESKAEPKPEPEVDGTKTEPTPTPDSGDAKAGDPNSNKGPSDGGKDDGSGSGGSSKKGKSLKGVVDGALGLLP